MPNRTAEATQQRELRHTEASHGSSSSIASGIPAASTSTTANNSKECKLPLPDDFFEPPPLSDDEQSYLVGLAKRACKEVVYYSRLHGGPMTWVPLASDNDSIELCQGIDESATHTNTKSLIYLRGATRIYATIDEIASFFRLDTPTKRSGFAQTVGRDILDQQTLYALAAPTPDNPKHYVAAKWTAIESPSKLARNRDFCYLECHDEFIDTTSKKRGWVRSVHSIRLPSCPRLDKSHGLVRGSLYRSGFVFLESNERGCVDAIHTLHMDVKGNSPNWIKVLAMKRRIKNIAQVNTYFQLQRLMQLRTLVPEINPLASNKLDHPNCHACETKFGLFHRKWRCRKCRNVVCSTCSKSFLIVEEEDVAARASADSLRAGGGRTKVRVCRSCSDAVLFGDRASASATVATTTSQRASVVVPVDDDVAPLYDDDPPTRETTSSSTDDDVDTAAVAAPPNRARAHDELDFYRAHEDPRSLRDMLECKRMQQAFEAHLSRPKADRVGSESESEASGSLSLDSGGRTLPADSPPFGPSGLEHGDEEDEDADSDDELGLPRSKSEQLEQLEHKRRDALQRRQQQRELHTATQTLSHHPHAPRRSLVHRSSSSSSTQQQRRSASRDRTDDSSSRRRLAHQDPFFEHFRHMEQSGDHLRKESLDAIRIASDWGDGDSDTGDNMDDEATTDAGYYERLHDRLNRQQQQHVGSLPLPSAGSFLHAAAAARTRVRRSDESSSSNSSSRARTRSSNYNNNGLRVARSQSPSRRDQRYRDDDLDQRYSQQQQQQQHVANRASPMLRPMQPSNDVRIPRRRSPFVTSREQDDNDDEHPPRYTDAMASAFVLDDDDGDTRLTTNERLERCMGGRRDREAAMPRTHSSDSRSSSSDRDRDELAHYMALSAMKLFEIEHGIVGSDDVRQKALSKMMAVYASEIERSSSARGIDRQPSTRGFHLAPTPVRRSASSSDRRQREVHRQQPLQRSFDDDLEQIPLFELAVATSERHAHARPRDLSAHSTSSSTMRSMEHDERNSMRRTDSFMGRPSPEQQAAALRASWSSAAAPRYSDLPPYDDHDHDHDGDLCRRRASIVSSRASSHSSRSSHSGDRDAAAAAAAHHYALQQQQQLRTTNAAGGDTESDTFSELDFVDFPHLMRKEYVAPPPAPVLSTLSTASTPLSDSSSSRSLYRTSFTDVHQWQQQQYPRQHERPTSFARDSIYYDGVERRLSELAPDDELLFRDSADEHHDEHHQTRRRRSASLSSANSSSSSSDAPDYVTESPRTAARPQMTLSELERYRASLAELMSDYTHHTHLNDNDDDEYDDRASLVESIASSLSIGSTDVYRAAHNHQQQQQQQPELEREPEREDAAATAKTSTRRHVDRRHQHERFL